MTRCLDEAMLQSYFDGELSGELMESATLHLASCTTCAAAAREIEQEIGLLMTALAAEFGASVPTEQLRQRVNTAVLDLRLDKAASTDKAGFGAFISGLLSFGSQRALGYASLLAIVAFAAIFGLMKMRTTPEQPIVATPPQTTNNPVVAVTTPPPSSAETIAPVSVSVPSQQSNPVIIRPVKATMKATPRPTPVKLIPGERAYLQTIARLDSTIKADQKKMRPALRVEYERNLAVVDRAIAATRSAVKSNPTDPDAADFMFAAYQSKVDLLNTIADARLGGGRTH